MFVSLAKLAVSDGSLRSLRCSLESRRLRRIRRNDMCCKGHSVFDAFHRLLLQIGGANIAGVDRAGKPLSPRSLADEERVCSFVRPAQRRAIRVRAALLPAGAEAGEGDGRGSGLDGVSKRVRGRGARG